MARVLAHRLCEITYRDNRKGRYLLVTISYLPKAMHRCDRSIQRYVKELIDEGYICVDVLKSHASKMVIGLKIRCRSSEPQRLSDGEGPRDEAVPTVVEGS